MTELKREYVVPLRRKSRTAPKWRRSKKAMSVLKEFITKHMKTDHIVIGNELNEKIWENGIKNPPGKVSIIALKKDFNGEERTLVNLLDTGIDSLLKEYEVAPKEVKKTKVAKSEDKKTEVKKEEVVDAEVKEKPLKEEKIKEEKKDE